MAETRRTGPAPRSQHQTDTRSPPARPRTQPKTSNQGPDDRRSDSEPERRICAHKGRALAADSALQIARVGATWLERERAVEPSASTCRDRCTELRRRCLSAG